MIGIVSCKILEYCMESQSVTSLVKMLLTNSKQIKI